MAYKENGSVVVNDNGEWTHSSFNTYTLTQTNIEATETKITASDAAADDVFGTAVAVGSGKIVVGAQWNDDNGLDSGSAYIYDLDGTNQIKITASDAAASDRFGASLAVGSGRIVVGAYNNDDVPDNSGSAYIYNLDGTNEIKITASDAASGDNFGWSVAVGNGKIVVGASGDDDNGFASGSAYIFGLDGTQLKKLTASDAASGDEFGNSVAVGNGRIVVGALGDNSFTGAAYIFDLDGTNQIKITASDAAADDYFGESVAVGSGRIVVGAPLSDDNGTSSGSAYIFDLNGNQLAKLTAFDGTTFDAFGSSVAAGNGRIVVGAPGDNSAHIFDLDGTFLTKIKPSDGVNNDDFGYRVAVGTGRIVVGAYGDSDDGARSGSAYIYDLPETTDIYWENIIENYKW